MTHLTIGDDTFEVRVEGEITKPACLLLHALGSDHSLFDAQMAALLTHFRVVRLDTRGHGGSPLGAGTVTIGRLGRDALAILDALEIETTHVVGLSLGGAVAQWLLINAPERIDRAVLAATAARFAPSAAWNARIATALSDGMSGLVDATIERWFGPAYREKAPERVEAMRECFLATAPAGYAACCAALRDVDLREALRRVDRPVLVVTGSDDPAIGDEDTALLLAAIDGAAHVGLSARHVCNLEAEEAFDDAVIEFLIAKRPVSKRPKAKTAGTTAHPTRVRETSVGRKSSRASAARNPLKPGAGAPKRLASTKSRRATATLATRPAPAKAGSRGKTTAKAKRPTGATTSVGKAMPATRPAPQRRKTTAVQPGPKIAKPVSKTAASKTAASKAAASNQSVTRAIASKTTIFKGPGRTKAAAPASTKATLVKPVTMKRRATKTSDAKTSDAKTSGLKSSPSAKPASSKLASAKAAIKKTAAGKKTVKKAPTTTVDKTTPKRTAVTKTPRRKPVSRTSPRRGR